LRIEYFGYFSENLCIQFIVFSGSLKKGGCAKNLILTHPLLCRMSQFIAQDVKKARPLGLAFFTSWAE
ncbi:MAG: hypothetical protein K2M27_08745, partial [Muribaculaceae bacterium]|nr:hypothetical protein [Muribaculaceae bacterium]